MPIYVTENATPLVVAADLAGYPGAPFAEPVVLAAGESVRRDAGWHIAPQLAETLTVDARGGHVLLLPTMYLVSVSAVRDVSGDTPTAITGWRKTLAGVLTLTSGYWPNGDETVEVDIVHGYPSCPPELLPAVAYRAQEAKTNRANGGVRLGSLSVSPGNINEDMRPDTVVAKFKVQDWP